MKRLSFEEIKKERAMSGERKTVLSADSNYLSLPSMSGAGLRSLRIQGKTEEEASVGTGGLSIRLLRKNLIDVDKFAERIIAVGGNHNASIVEVDGRRCIKFMNSTLRLKNFTSCVPVFKKNTRYIFSFEARPYTIPADDAPYEYHLYMGLSPEGICTFKGISAKEAHDFTRIYNVNKAGTTATDLYFSWGAMYYWLIDLDSVYLYEYENDTDPEYEAPSTERADIATVTADGSEIEVSLGQDEALILENGTVRYEGRQGTYDLTFSDFGRSLLEFTGKRGEDHIVAVRGALAPSEIVAEYYTLGQGDTATLRIKYLCDGVEIMQAKEYLTRKNGAFTVIAPSIEGYLPQKRQISGVINGDTEISIEYRGKK